MTDYPKYLPKQIEIRGARVHNLKNIDVIRNADYLIDMGPGGGNAGGRIVAEGTPEEVKVNPESATGRYI